MQGEHHGALKPGAPETVRIICSLQDIKESIVHSTLTYILSIQRNKFIKPNITLFLLTMINKRNTFICLGKGDGSYISVQF